MLSRVVGNSLEGRRLGGIINAVDPNREIDFGFGFVFVSCVRACVRAKLCERVRDVILNAGVPNGEKYSSGVGFGAALLAAIR